ncbi:MAG: GNAT family N-acetyltransferase [Paramuribaculum sp.]|nr:GNAT family N-acetyltransferase [Paramuribaculum sp.]
MEIRRYTPGDKELWDNFLDRSRCGTFLFKRDYMEYHADRFEDCSLMAFNRRGKLIAMLPAEIRGASVSSHRGLTYGGWISPSRHFDGTTMEEVFTTAISTLRNIGATELIYKPLPHIYQTVSAEEDLFCLYRLGAVQTGCLLSSVTDLRHPAPMNESTRQGIKLAYVYGVDVQESNDFSGFWLMLTEQLLSRHDAAPVHSLSEIILLKKRFQENIKLFTASLNGKMIAGAVLYLCKDVVRVQYMSSDETGRKAKALTAIIHHLYNKFHKEYRYLDMGSSNEPDSGELNNGLLLFKSGLGGRGIAFTTYRIAL